MAETISMPKLGFDMAEGLLVRWVRQVGETINKGDVLAEIETDKATVEVESSASGVVLQLIVDQGTMVPVNAPIAIIGAAGEAISDQSPVISEKKVDEKPAASICADKLILFPKQLLPLMALPSKPAHLRRKSPVTKKWICPT